MKFDIRKALVVSIPPILFAVGFAQLAASFNYPAILRVPPQEALSLFAKNQSAILPWWWAMFVAALAFVPLSALVPKWIDHENNDRVLLITAVGVAAAFFQALGLSRWVFAVPVMAADPADLLSIKLFEVLNQWFGVGLGEWSGYLFTAAWSILISIQLLKSSCWLGGTGIIVSLGVASGLLEVFGFTWAGAVNAISYSLWVLWMIALAIYIARLDTNKHSETK